MPSWIAFISLLYEGRAFLSCAIKVSAWALASLFSRRVPLRQSAPGQTRVMHLVWRMIWHGPSAQSFLFGAFGNSNAVHNCCNVFLDQSLCYACKMQEPHSEFWLHLWQTDSKTRCIDQFLENISSRDGRVFRPSFLEAQGTVQEASEAQLVMHICFTLHSPRTIKGEVLRGSERVCIHKTTEVLKSLWGTCSHHCFTSLFESLFLFCSLPQQLYLSREKWVYCRWCWFISCRENWRGEWFQHFPLPG